MPHDTQRLFVADEDPPTLIGGKCQDCGHIFFPMQRFGCVRCGSENLVEYKLAGTGKVVTAATVHVHPDPSRPTPFTIVAVALDDGPAVRALAASKVKDDIKIGDQVVAVLVSETRPDHGEHELRFTLPMEAR